MKKLIAMLLVVCMLLALGACSNDSEKSSATSSTSEASSSGSESSSNEPGKSSDKPEKLVFWTMWNDAETQAIDLTKAAEEYTAETGIKIEITYNGRQNLQLALTALNAGTQIDFADGDLDDTLNTWKNYMTDLDKYAKQSYPTTNGKPLDEVLNQTLIKVAREIGGGTLKNIPFQPCSFVIMYNKGAFKDAGVTKAPDTWDEFLVACKKIKDSGIIPITVDDAYLHMLFGSYLERMIGVDETVNIIKNNAWDNEAVRKTVGAWKEMYDLGYFSPKASTNVYPAGQQDIGNGTVAMYFNGTWLPDGLRNVTAADFEWGQFAFPTADNAKYGKEANYFGAQSFAIFNTSKYPQEAFNYIASVVSGKWDEQIAKDTWGIPMATDAEWPACLADTKTIFENTTVRFPNNFNMQDDQNQYVKLKANFAKLISGKLDVDRFITEMCK